MKKSFVESALQRIGGFTGIPVNDTIGMDEPYKYRNKAQFPIGYKLGSRKEGSADKSSVIAGFYAPGTHDIAEIEFCGIHDGYASLEPGIKLIK